MNDVLEKHEIGDSFYIYLQRNSTVWLARFKVGGKWISRTTKQREKASAIVAAVKVKTECDIKHEHGITIQTKAFKHVAELAIERMRETPVGTKGQASYKDYEWFLRKHHIPFFDRIHITSIDRAKLMEFDRWREKNLGRSPSQSTLKSHNAAMQRVFDEAVIRRWMTVGQVPALTTSGGTAGTRRDYFTPAEVQKIADAFPEWIRTSRNRPTQEVRELLYTYFQFAVHTGLRPGTEMDNLRWNDVELKKDHVVITVRKGKTTLYTGNRVAIGHSTILDMILDMHEKSLDTDVPDDHNPLVFRLPDGSTSNQLGRNFTMLLKRLGLENGPGGKRTLYSLRHTYISLRLLEGVSPSIIAKQCGTSAEMIQRHYDHLTTLMHVKELVGSEGAELTKLIRAYSALE
jgi:integrase